MSKTNLVSGFTLVELVIVMAIFGVLFSVVSATFLNSLKAATKAEATKEVRQNGEVILSRLSHDIREAKNIIDCPNNTQLRLTDKADNIITYGVSSASPGPANQLLRLEGAQVDRITDPRSVRIGLTPANATTLSFACLDDKRVDISFELQYIPFRNVALLTNAPAEEQIRILFQTTVVNRNVD